MAIWLWKIKRLYKWAKLPSSTTEKSTIDKAKHSNINVLIHRELQEISKWIIAEYINFSVIGLSFITSFQILFEKHFSNLISEYPTYPTNIKDQTWIFFLKNNVLGLKKTAYFREAGKDKGNISNQLT